MKLGSGLLLLMLAGCVPPDPPEGTTERPLPSERRSAEAQRPRARAQVEDEDKSGASPTSAGADTKARESPAASAGTGASPAGDTLIASVFRDAFDRDELGPSWRTASSAWRIEDGRLCGKRARNQPVWLSARLPVNARIEFEATSKSDHGDIKAEAWGDGRSSAAGTSYTDATSYIFILGGWQNRYHVLARLDEHAPDRAQVEVGGADLRARPVVRNRSYHIKIERSDGRTVRWLVDDIEILTLVDASPLSGAGHEYFAFNDWDVPVCFDDLVITPL